MNISFKNKVIATIIISALAVSGYKAKKIFWPSSITNKEAFAEFVGEYLQSSGDPKADVEQYFTDMITIFYTYRNIKRERVNEIRKRTDYIDTHLDIDKNSIKLRSANGINYWRFIGALTCYRPSKNMYEKCNVDMEYGLDHNNKIASIDQIDHWGLSYTKDRPE